MARISRFRYFPNTDAAATSLWRFNRHLEIFTATGQADFLPTDSGTVLMNPICDLPIDPGVVPLCQSLGAIQYQIPGAPAATDRLLC